MSSVSGTDSDLPTRIADVHDPILATVAAAHAEEISDLSPRCKEGEESLPNDEENPTPVGWTRRLALRLGLLLRNYHFPILIVLSIAAARIYPPLGADYLQPEITANWIAIAVMFFLSGLSVRVEQFAHVVQLVYFNVTVEIFNFFVVSSVIFGASRILLHVNVLGEALADGMVICGCLPVAITAVIVLVVASRGNEAAAVFHATIGNVIGIFLSPVLISAYLGTTGQVSLGEVMLNLTYRVVVPLLAGQIAQFVSKRIRTLADTHKRASNFIQEGCLVYIVYAVFCHTFEGDSKAEIGDIFIMIVTLLILMIGLFAWAWVLLQHLFPDEPELRITGLFACVQKTIALGVPLIASMYEDDPAIGLYTLPILIWHPMQLVVGSLMIPSLLSFGEKERSRLDELDDNAQGVDEIKVSEIEEKKNDEIDESLVLEDSVSRV